MLISEALGWAKILKARYNELVELRNENCKRSTRYLDSGKEIKDEPTYSVQKVDKLIVRIAREMRLLDQAIKNTNATTEIKGCKQDESVLGEVE